MRGPMAEYPLRSLLFVPGNSPDKVQKAWKTGADGIIFDLEDAVADSDKPAAREMVRKAIDGAPRGDVSTFVRINSYSTPFWEDDLKAVIGRNLRGIVLPKCGSPDEVSSLENVLDLEEKSNRLASESICLLLLIESARGLLRVPQLAEASRRVAALIFGAEDFALDMGIPRTTDGASLLYARSYLPICARAYGCLAIDAVYPDFKDDQGLLRETETGKRLGFNGKLAIHPKQVGLIHAAFAPSDLELAEARKILEAFAEARGRGESVFALDGKMIDRPIVERARRLVALAESRR